MTVYDAIKVIKDGTFCGNCITVPSIARFFQAIGIVIHAAKEGAPPGYLIVPKLTVISDSRDLVDGALYWVRYADTKEMFTNSPHRATAFMLGNHIVTKAGPNHRDEFTGRYEAVEVSP